MACVHIATTAGGLTKGTRDYTAAPAINLEVIASEV